MVVLIAAPLPALAAQSAQAAMTVDVAGGKWKAVRLRNLPKDASLAVVVQSGATIGVSLLKEQDFKLFPQPQEPVFMGSSERRLSFTVKLPESGTYYLVLDNRASADAQKVKFAIRAQRGAGPDSPPPPAAVPQPRSPQQEF
jgi:hypothetical protein